MDASRERSPTPERLKIWKLRRSRDSWKAKCRQRRQQVRELEARLRDLERSRDAWREHCLSLDAPATPSPDALARPLPKKAASTAP